MFEENSLADQSGKSAGITTLVLVVLGVIQIVLGSTISKSIALTANGIDCVGDGFVSAVVWVGLRFIRRPADDRFHYGYYKVENLASIAAAIIMIVLAAYIIIRSYSRLLSPHEIETPLIGAGVAMVAAITAWGLGIRKYLRGRSSNMSSVKLEALNTIKDGTASFLAVIALVLASVGYPIADAIVGFIIAGVIITIGFAAMKESSLTLVDACDGYCMDQSLALRKKVEEIDGVYASRIIRLRKTGPVIQGEIEVAVAPEMSVSDFDQIRTKILDIVRTDFPEFAKLLVSSHPHREGQPDFEDQE